MQLSHSDKASRVIVRLITGLLCLNRSREKYWPARESYGAHFNWNSFSYLRCSARTFLYRSCGRTKETARCNIGRLRKYWSTASFKLHICTTYTYVYEVV